MPDPRTGGRLIFPRQNPFGPFSGTSISMDRAALTKALVDIMERSAGESVGAVEEGMRLKEDLHLDSLDFVTMAIEAQSEFNIELKSTEFTDVLLVKDLLDLLERKMQANRLAA
jgi:acyl carrier protein